MATLNIVFGFEEAKFQKTIERTLIGLGHEVHIQCKYSKNAVADFLRTHREYTHVVLKENFSRSKYTDVELAELTEERDINVIVVLAKSHKGTPYMETLYAAGITGALFMEGNGNSDATVQNVTELLLHKRKRVDARKYYGIGEKVNIRLNSISDGKLSDLLQSLDDVSYGSDVGKRFAQLCTTLSPKQVVDFITRMPRDTKAALEKCDDYWMVITALEAHGVTIKSKKYQQNIKNFSKRARIKAANERVSISDKNVNADSAPPASSVGHAPKQEPSMYNVPTPPVDIYADNNVDNSDLFEQSPQQPQYQTQQPMQQPYPQAEYQQAPYQQNPYQQPYQQPYPQEQFQQDPYNQYQQPMQEPVPQNQMGLPPTNDWRELKRREKVAKKQAKKDAKNNRYKRIEPQKEQAALPNSSMQFQDNTPITNLHPKRAKDETKRKEVALRIGIVIAVIAFIGLIIVVSIGVNSMTRTTAIETEKEQQLLNEQMNDLAEIRSGEAINLANVVPVTAAVANGEQLMGVQVMDVINTDMQLYYVVNTDGSLYTYEGGGATSNEVDVNSMYYAQMLSSGRFAFYEQ